MKKTKADLEIELESVNKDFEKFKNKVIESITRISLEKDGKEYIKDFCDDVGIEYPQKTLLLEIKVDVDLDEHSIEVYDEHGNSIEIEKVTKPLQLK